MLVLQYVSRARMMTRVAFVKHFKRFMMGMPGKPETAQFHNSSFSLFATVKSHHGFPLAAFAWAAVHQKPRALTASIPPSEEATLSCAGGRK